MRYKYCNFDSYYFFNLDVHELSLQFYYCRYNILHLNLGEILNEVSDRAQFRFYDCSVLCCGNLGSAKS